MRESATCKTIPKTKDDSVRKKGFLMVLIQGLSGAVIAQGTLNFSNTVGMPLDAFCSSGLVSVASPWLADLYYGPVGSPECLLTPLNQPAVIQSGYFQGGVKTIANYAPGTTIETQIRVWNLSDGNSWDDAVRSSSPSTSIALSPVFHVTLAQSVAAPSLPAMENYCLRLNEPPVTWRTSFQVSLVLTNTLLFSWDIRANYRLQQNSTLSSSNWVTLPEVPWTDWYKSQLAIPRPPQSFFYRLVLQ